MLIEFTVANYRSFREPAVFSMVAANLKSKDERLDENNVFSVDGQPPLLTVASIYGRNASGKSNLVRALGFMRRFVIESFASTEEIGSIAVEPFRLSTVTAEAPSHFEIVLVADGVRYRYGFEATQERVTAEWLYAVPKRSEALLFERQLDTIKFGRTFREGRERRQFTRPNALFLTVLAQTNAPSAQRLLAWFRRLGVASSVADVGMRMYTVTQLLAGRNVEAIERLVTAADTGVEGLRVEQSQRDEAPNLPAGMPAELRTALTALINHGDNVRVDVNTLHTVYDAGGKAAGQVEFDMEKHESEGTRKIFALAGPLSHAIIEGQVLIIDEFDARFHPLLTQEIIRIFSDPVTNSRHAQLVIVTHDTGLLDNRLLRRDQIWFVDKDDKGASTLYSMAEFKGVRNDLAYEASYLHGRFGAVPYVRELTSVLRESQGSYGAREE